jgi:ATP-dependent RNA helicase DeaD
VLDDTPESATGEDTLMSQPASGSEGIDVETHDDTSEAPKTGFAALGLPPRLLKTLDDLGFVDPTPIQVSTIPPLLTGRDIVGVAQTGTGKTAAFGLPMLAGIDPHRHVPQGLVLAPTRELALQVARALQDLAAGSPHIHITAVYGGAPWLAQKRALQAGTHVVVGTPGRIIDHLDRGTLDLSSVHFVVLDEGDEMLRMGFAEEVDRILTGVPEQRQIALFSATMPPEIQRTVEAHLHNPRKIAVSAQSSTVDSIDQRYAIVPQRHKVAALARVLATTEADATLVFVQTKAAAEEVGASLVQRGVAASVISGDVPQNDREKVVERLRSGQLDVVVATDVAARGLDVDRIGLVVNLDMPREIESYVHRIGRTGRAGRTGVALSFITPKERDRLRRVEKATKAELTAMTIPTVAEVSRHRVASLLAKVPKDGGADGAVRRAVEDFLGGRRGAHVGESDADLPWYALVAEAGDSVNPAEAEALAADFGDSVDVPETGASSRSVGPNGEPTDGSAQSPIDWEALERTWNTGPLWSGADGAAPRGGSFGGADATMSEAGPANDKAGDSASVGTTDSASAGTASDLAQRAIDLAAALVELAVDGRGSMSLDDDGMDEELGRVARRGRDHERPPKGGGSRDRASRERGYDRKRRDRDGRDGDGPDRDRRGPARDGDHGASADRRPHRGGKQPEFRRYWIGVGRRHGVNPGAIVGALTNEGGLHGRDLGKIDMFAGFSIVEIAPTLNGQAMRRLSRASVAGQPLRIRPDLSAKSR